MTFKISHKRTLEIAGIILFILPFLLIAFYVHPYHDDFIIASIIRENSNWLAHQREVFMNWSGRFFATFIAYVSPLSEGIYSLYKYVIIANILFFWFTLYLFSHGIMKKTGYPRYATLLWIFLLVLIHSIILSPAEFYYWKAASLAYLLSISMALACTFLLLKEKRKTIDWITGFILILGAVASNEVTAAGWGIFIFLYLIVKHKFDNIRAFDLYIAGISLLTVIIFIIAPGNYERFEVLSGFDRISQSQNIIHVFFRGATLAGKFLAYHFQSPAVIIGSILFLIGFPGKNRLWLNNIPVWLQTVSGILIIWILCSLLYLLVGVTPAFRVLNIIQVIIIFIWCLFLIRIKNYLYQNNIKTTIPATIGWGLIGAFFLLILTDFTYKQKPGSKIRFRNNIPHTIYDLAVNAKLYDRQMEKRHKKLTKSHKNDKVQLEPLRAKPETIFLGDITTDPENYLNQPLARYYNVEEVYLSTKEK